MNAADCCTGTSTLKHVALYGSLAHFKLWKSQLSVDEIVTVSMVTLPPKISNAVSGSDFDIVTTLRLPDGRWSSPTYVNTIVPFGTDDRNPSMTVANGVWTAGWFDLCVCTIV